MTLCEYEIFQKGKREVQGPVSLTPVREEMTEQVFMDVMLLPDT